MLRLLALLACAAALEPSIGGGRRMTVLDGTLNETYAWGPFGYQTLEGLGENNNITLSAWVTGAMAGGDEANIPVCVDNFWVIYYPCVSHPKKKKKNRSSAKRECEQRRR